MKLGIIANINRPNARSVVERVVSWCRDNSKDFCLSDKLRDILPPELPF